MNDSMLLYPAAGAVAGYFIGGQQVMYAALGGAAGIGVYVYRTGSQPHINAATHSGHVATMGPAASTSALASSAPGKKKKVNYKKELYSHDKFMGPEMGKLLHQFEHQYPNGYHGPTMGPAVWKLIHQYEQSHHMKQTNEQHY